MILLYDETLECYVFVLLPVLTMIKNLYEYIMMQDLVKGSRMLP